MQRLLVLLFCTALWLPLNAKDADGKRVGLVLSGGAARGLAHIGVLRALEEQGIEVDIITGTSMGAIIGAMYASGYSVDQIEQLGTELDWGYALTDTPPRQDLTFRRKQDDRRHLLRTKLTVVDGTLRLPAGVLDGQNLDLLLQNIFRQTDDINHFDQLPIPFRAIATDLETGSQVVLADGSLARAIRASMSIPGMLTPVRHKGRLLADGGMANNMPVDVARALGAERIIAVDIGSPLSNADELGNVFAISNQVTTFLTIKNVQEQIATLTTTDQLLQPDLKGITSLDFTRAGDAIALGYAAAMAAQPQLASLAGARQGPTPDIAIETSPTITRTTLENDSYLNNQALLGFIEQKPGTAFNRKQLERNINTLYGLEYFESINYALLTEGDGKRLHLRVKGDKRHKGFIRFGFNASDNFTGDNYYNISLGYNQTGITDTGAEWFSQVQLGNDIRIATELFVPLNYKSPFYIKPTAEYLARDVPVYDDNLETQLLMLRDRRVTGALAAGLQFSHYTDISVAMGAADGRLNVQTGTADIDNYGYQQYFTDIALQYDSEDNIYFPTSGSRVNLRHRKYYDQKIDNADYVETEAFISHAHTAGKNTFIGRLQSVRTNGENALPSSVYFLGGFGQISGMPENSIVTQNHDLAALFYLRLLNSPLLVFDTRYYFVASLEHGRAWNDRASAIPFDMGNVTAGSLGVAMDSPVGPVVLSYGFNSADQQSVYFSIGRAL
ncbi:patatin-like phospholipase family protein [Simiduia sp. 21SJ11W-1]|uniref:patatin-like phospholipase family protein n=1 Tax=Simiduia sp. 21SJ11W-1 TaxID=2909669 RepID=UPI00209F859C|nr:patatin-like phospholipase family protein [Simiduia sp. 21SJ11W-1]UTA48205.1 patatin-like phospholipase family protein [Simiduia sp. 21SJ11W-1]